MIRIATDTGGTFTDLALELEDGSTGIFKSPSTPDHPVRGVLDAVGIAASSLGIEISDLLSRTATFIHATTWATNALLERKTEKTAILVTAGHPDILFLREGGRDRPFDFRRAYPDPYVPRALTFEVPERITRDGVIVTPLDAGAVAAMLEQMRNEAVGAIAVCLLWSPVNPHHELQIGRMIEQMLPGVPYTLSHQLNPVIREYRRGVATAIDASLKPLMSGYLNDLKTTLASSGFSGQLLLVTSNGSVMNVETVANAPIHLVASGPAMAPVAGRHHGSKDGAGDTLIVADTGGTTYDISLVHRGWIPRTKEKWLGVPYQSDITGFPSIDVRSSGSGGGSIAWVDDGGLLRLGPRSAGAVPGPACYGKGGTEPTLTDACAVTGLIRPDYFLGGKMRLAAANAREAIERHVAGPLSLEVEAAAAAVIELATEQMARAIEDITLHQGVDPRNAVLVAGGGAGGMNAVAIANRLGCRSVLIPSSAAVLSAAGALISDISMDFSAPLLTNSRSFDFGAVNATLAALKMRAAAFLDGLAPRGEAPTPRSIEFFVEARYPHQVWDIEIKLRSDRFSSAEDVAAFVADFHQMHRRMFEVSDDKSSVELVSCRCRGQAGNAGMDDFVGPTEDGPSFSDHAAPVYWPRRGWLDTRIHHLGNLNSDTPVEGPAIVVSSVTTVSVDPDMQAHRLASGSLLIDRQGSMSRAHNARPGR